MNELPQISLQQARLIMLNTLGLAYKARGRARKEDLLKTIRYINFLQLDTISVVARAHLHILYSRLGAYQTKWLEELHAEGRLFEYFAHAMCFLPIEDFSLYWPDMLRRRESDFFGGWALERQEKLEAMLAAIRERGPMMSSDFKGERTGPWWGWKEEKGLLEALFYRGELMIARREGFKRVYDLRERVLPNWQPSEGLSLEESVRLRYLQAAKLLGVSTDTWLSKQTYLPNARTVVKELVAEKRLITASIKGFAKPIYVHPENLPVYERGLEGKLSAPSTKILSMFDPLMVDRDRVKALFGFDYKIQVYVPKAQRDKGYYLLPILHQGKLVGRLDAKAFRKEGFLQVLAIHLEPGVKPSQALAKGLADELKAYGSWMGLNTVKVELCIPQALKERLLKHL
ncbi:MAG: crosslink repair DNA glycosylase YcaQ family protein [Anaerolineaceae bacterium]|nr:crosslink repair DNA glycosylase YcaQ family protein [Anaerolineaceae bacterium]